MQSHKSPKWPRAELSGRSHGEQHRSAQHAGCPVSALVERFGVAVRQLRIQNGWSQSQLAERSGLDRSYVGEIERGRVIASILTAEKLAIALQLDVASLLAHCELLNERRADQFISLTAIAR